jgi:branched-chain amino acid aminotransferase
MNGELRKWGDSKVHILTHALHYATAVFEGIRAYSTSRGPAIFRLADHITRMFDSAKIYMMEIPYTPEQLFEAVKQTVIVNKLEECYIRPVAYYSYGEMGLNPLPNKVDVAIAAWIWESYLGKDADSTGVRCQVSSWRRVHPAIMPPQAKSTANYANSSLAKVEALKAGYDEAILLNMDDMVAEGTGENIFRVKDGALSTPPAASGVLRGITRDTTIQIAKDYNIAEFIRGNISREELYTSDELFLTGTAAGITAIKEVDGRKIGKGDYPIVTRIKDIYADIVHGKNSKYSKWLELAG